MNQKNDNNAEKTPKVKMALCALESDIKNLLSGLLVYPTNDPLVECALLKRHYRLGFLTSGKTSGNLRAFDNLPTELVDCRIFDNKFICKFGLTPLIPYITYLLHVKGKFYVFIYKQNTSSDENHPHNLYSIGVGGHIEINKPGYLSLTLANNIKQKTKGRFGVDIDNYDLLRCISNSMFILDSRTSKVSTHCGINNILSYSDSKLPTFEPTFEEGHINDPKWLLIGDLREKVASGEIKLETWSEHVLKHML
jgi:predicted NUDIX family phosphoesterase